MLVNRAKNGLRPHNKIIIKGFFVTCTSCESVAVAKKIGSLLSNDEFLRCLDLFSGPSCLRTCSTPVTTSNGIILTFWHLARLTSIVRLKRSYLFESYNQH